jgi:23S rRNA (uracil1939-C5)-methyltransferase
MLTMTRTLVIDRIGAKGDAVARTPEGDVFLSGALPGETVTAVVDGERGDLVSVERASAERVPAPCGYFGRCGGCALQHWAAEPYARWKAGLVAVALKQAGLDAAVAPLVPAQGEGRHRVILHARRRPGGWEVGFMARRTHDLVAVDTCPILVPALADAPRVAKSLCDALGGDKPLDVQITATGGGLDVDLRGHGPVSDGKRRVLGETARELRLARLSLHGDVIAANAPTAIRMGDADVRIPPGGFLQATAEGEETLARLVLDGVGKAKKVADLFAGVGPFTFRLARTAKVHAAESDAAAVAALQAAARETQGLKPITAEVRDLFKRPLVAAELAGFDAVVFDPPRAGAKAQAQALAGSVVPRVVAVSCDAGTFARDAAILAAGGYRILSVTPVDQFLYSGHVETVAVFEKNTALTKKRRVFG